MTTRPPDSTHEAEQTPPLPPDDARGKVESPGGELQGASGLRPDPDADSNEPDGGDQDIDTAGTDADDQSPTKALGTGTAPSRSKG
jgi:hypothetical protein